MAIKDALGQAIKEENHAEILRIVDILRANGRNYAHIREIVQQVSNLDARDWDALLYECESESEAP